MFLCGLSLQWWREPENLVLLGFMDRVVGNFFQGPFFLVFSSESVSGTVMVPTQCPDPLVWDTGWCCAAKSTQGMSAPSWKGCWTQDVLHFALERDLDPAHIRLSVVWLEVQTQICPVRCSMALHPHWIPQEWVVFKSLSQTWQLGPGSGLTAHRDQPGGCDGEVSPPRHPSCSWLLSCASDLPHIMQGESVGTVLLISSKSPIICRQEAEGAAR